MRRLQIKKRFQKVVTEAIWWSKLPQMVPPLHSPREVLVLSKPARMQAMPRQFQILLGSHCQSLSQLRARS